MKSSALQVEVKNCQKKIPIVSSRIIPLVQQILKHQGVVQADLSIAVVGNRAIRSLNKKFLRHDYATDVIAFGREEEKKTSPTAKRRRVNGDVVLSGDAAFRQAGEFGTSPYFEVVLYITHGILHLLGFDDHSPRDTARMRAEEAKVMKRFARDVAQLG